MIRQTIGLLMLVVPFICIIGFMCVVMFSAGIQVWLTFMSIILYIMLATYLMRN